jgi:hypothetical protein
VVAVRNPAQVAVRLLDLFVFQLSFNLGKSFGVFFRQINWLVKKNGLPCALKLVQYKNLCK